MGTSTLGGRARAQNRARQVVASVLILVLVAASVIGWRTARHAESDDHRRHRAALAAEAGASLGIVLQQALGGLAGAQGLVQPDQTVEPGRFAAFVEGLRAVVPLQTLAVEQVVPGAQRPFFEMAHAPIFDQPAGGKPIPAPPRTSYLPVVTVSPPSATSQSLIGFDLGADATRGPLAAAARASGQAQLSPPIRLVNSARHGILLLQPLKGAGPQASTVVGSVSAVFIADDLRDALLRRLPSRLGIVVTDGDVPAFSGGPHVTASTRAGPAAPVTVLGHAYRVWATDGSTTSHNGSWAILGLGLAVALALAASLAFGLRQEERLDQSAGRLRRERDLRDVVFGSLAEGLLVRDTTGEIVEGNDAWWELVGTDPNEGETWSMVGVLPDEVSDELTMGGDRRDVQVSTETGRVFRAVTSERRLVDSTTHEVLGTLSTMRDITRRVRAEERLRVLSRLTTSLAGASDSAAVGNAVLELVPAAAGADVAAVYLVQDREIRRLGLRTMTPGQHLPDKVANDATTPIGDAVAKGEVVGGTVEALSARYPGIADTVAKQGLRSVLAVPFGLQSVDAVLLLGWTTGDRDPNAERELLGPIRPIMAQALSRARRAELADSAAKQFQSELLTLQAPSAAHHLDISARYRPSEEAMSVGGDWYDVVEVGGRCWCVVGDVVGSGLSAAVAMGQLRSAIRALITADDDPVAVLRHLDEFAESVRGGIAATVAVVELSPDGSIRHASAGHPPAVILGTNGAVRPLDGGRGWPLASFETGVRPDCGSGRLDPGERLVLYTDGLIERRGESLDTGLDRLAAAVYDRRDASPDAAVDPLIDALVPSGARHDDIVVLIVDRYESAAVHSAA